MDIRQTPRFALLFIAALAAGSALAAEDINRVNGAITAHAGSEYGRLETVNGSITLGKGSAREIRAAVRDALSVFGRAGGFILSPVDALFPDTPWQNVRIMIEAWKEYR